MANGGALAVAESDDDPGRALGLPAATATGTSAAVSAPDTSRRLGIADLVDSKATEDLKKIAGETAAEDQKVIEAQNTLLNQDRARLARQYEATGINPGEFRPWNADVEMSKYRTEPLAAFASLGSVLGILASSFTHAPLQNALNASAAAMTAMHEGDEKAYEKAHTAWKENTELVFKRHELEQQRFNDALSLMKTDMSVGEAQLRNNLIMSGDKKALAMMNAGMFQELIDYKAKEAETVLKSRIAVDEINKLGISQAWENAMIKQIPDEVKKDPLHYSAALQNIVMTSQMLNSKDIDKQALGNWQAQYLKDHDFQPPSTEEIAAKLREMSEAKHPLASRGASGLSVAEMQAFNDRRQQLLDEGMEPADASNIALTEVQEARAKAHPGRAAGAGPAIPSRIDAAAVEDRIKQEINEGTLDGGDPTAVDRRRQAIRNEQKTMAIPITSNKRDDIASQITRIDIATKTIDKVEALLKKHKAMTGLGGTITRPGETVSNWFGGNETDRAQFKSYIDELRAWEPRITNESKSRPLAAEEKQVASIVPGLSLGDTTVNTAKRLVELQKLFREFQKNLTQRYEGKYTPPEIPAAPDKSVPKSKSPWETDKVVQ